MALQASSFSSSITYGFDVFLSFRGEDTRRSFTGHLYKALCNRGIHTSIDDEKLPRGNEITPSLESAIENSRIAIIVLSKNYASSSFCLDELATIMKCVKEKGRLVLPIFYHVDPSDVRHHRRTYGEALVTHEKRFKDDKEKVKKWREALYQVANLPGEHLKLGNEYEYVFIEKIVKEISNKISRVLLHVAEYPVGLESQVLIVNKLLNDGSNGKVHVVGIYGVGGIGKTTLARAIYNLVADQFEDSCFLENVRENSIKHGLVYLQEILLSKILGEKDIKLTGVSEGSSIIKHRFQSKRVLLVLDDVDKHEQLQAIAGSLDWFDFGSKVIITTRDKHLLADHRVESKYEVNGLNEKEALELLGWHAFKSEKADPNYMDILNKVVSYASGLPLALVVIGSNLYGRSIEEWKSALDEYKKIPDKDIHRILKVSFDALGEYQQKFFLDIACCFKGYELVDVENILHAHHDVCPKFGICVLVERSLIKISEHGLVTLHDLIQDMGREIVRQESQEKPGERSRLWLPKEIMQVLQENTGTTKIEIINSEAPMSEVVEWDGQAFEKMKSLKTLIIRNGNFFEGPKHLPNSLRVLEWSEYPSHSLPADFHPRKLAILKLSDNCFTSLPLVRLLKEFVNMTVLNFRGNKWITHIPNVSGAPNLETLDFARCVKLIKIDESVGFLGKLRILQLWGCKMLRSFLPSLMLPSLESLTLSGCHSLENFPEILGKMEKLTSLNLSHTSIKELPYSICNLTRLQELRLYRWGSVSLLLPSSIFMFRELNVLHFSEFECLLLPNQDEGAEQVSSVVSSSTMDLCLMDCNLSDELLQMFLPRFSNVETLNLSTNNFTILPACIKDCCSLRSLLLYGCKNLQEIGGIPPNIEHLSAYYCTSMSWSSRELLLNKKLHEEHGKKRFRLPGTRIPEWFEHQSSGRSISFWFRNKIPAISVCLVFKEEHISELNCPGLRLAINGKRCFHSALEESSFFDFGGHIYIYDLEDDAYKVYGGLVENEWNQAVIVLPTNKRQPKLKDHGSIGIGLHIMEGRSSMDDIRFTDPLLHEEEHRAADMRDSHNHHMQQQQTNLASLEPHAGNGRESLLCLPPPALNDNLIWDSNSKLISSSTTITVQDQAATEKAPGESSHTLGSAETQNIQAPSPTSLSGKASEEELYLKSSCTTSSTSIDKSLRKNEISDDDDDDDDDDVEMDAFYASSDAGIPMLSHSHVKLATTAPSEEARKALRSVHVFISHDASILLDPEQCSNTKASLDYLSKLSADDGISREMGKLMSEASQLLTHWSRDYIEASTKIDSITSELQRADELEMSLEGNKEKFREVVALKNETLEEQLSATKANMSVSQSEKSITRKRKREIFEEGKKLKAQLDDLRKNVPQWEQEHISAKKVRAKIKAEWPKLGEKFNKMVEKWNLYAR